MWAHCKVQRYCKHDWMRYRCQLLYACVFSQPFWKSPMPHASLLLHPLGPLLWPGHRAVPRHQA